MKKDTDFTPSKKPTLVERLGFAGVMGTTLFVAFILWVNLNVALEPRYDEIRQMHRWLSRGMVVTAIIMLLVAVDIGLIRRADVTPWFRQMAFTILAFVTAQGMLGVTMWALGGQPGKEVHLIYGFAAVLALPFFMFVEMTSPKRPAMGSYIWGFAMLTAITIRCLMTGPPIWTGFFP